VSREATRDCATCGRSIDDRAADAMLCSDCEAKPGESQDERRHEGDEKHGK